MTRDILVRFHCFLPVRVCVCCIVGPFSLYSEFIFKRVYNVFLILARDLYFVRSVYRVNLSKMILLINRESWIECTFKWAAVQLCKPIKSIGIKHMFFILLSSVIEKIFLNV